MLPATTNGVIFADWRLEGGTLVRRMVQPGDDAILSDNAERRKDPDSVRKLDWGKLALKIPENHLFILQKKYPDLNAPHGHTRYLAWLKFLNSAESEPYRVYPRSRARAAHK